MKSRGYATAAQTAGRDRFPSTNDMRDLTFYLATLHYSAMKLGIDTRRLFSDKASLETSISLQNEVRRFALRLPKDRNLSAFGLRETITSEGFDLVQDRP